MGRRIRYDDDEYRLPEGMHRVAYDADSQTYTYRDAKGTLYRGAEGAQYGELKKVESKGFAQTSEPSSPDTESASSKEKPGRIITRRFTDFSQLDDCNNNNGNDRPQATIAPLVMLRRTLTRRKNQLAERPQSSSSQAGLLSRSRSSTV